MKLIIVTISLCLWTTLICARESTGSAFWDSFDAGQKRRQAIEVEKRTCENYIRSAADVEKNTLGEVSRILQDGLALLKTRKYRLSDLQGIVLAHKESIALRRTLLEQQAFEQEQEAFRQVVQSQQQQLNQYNLKSAERTRFAKEAQAKLGGKLEVRLEDGTRCDLINDTHAYDVEYASKWKEAIGQSLHYALLTDKQAGIILIITGAPSIKHLEQIETLIRTYSLPIDVFEVQNRSEIQ